MEETYHKIQLINCKNISIQNKFQNLNSDPLSPEVEIKALAGPMSKDQANVSREKKHIISLLRFLFEGCLL